MTDAVAVIVPNYNNEKVLRACLESIYAQTNQPAEVLVVDDASTDTSRAIAKEFPCQLIELPVNRGQSAARNTGVAASSAPLLFFVDSDCALLPDAIENAVRVLHQTPGCGMVQGIYELEPLYEDGAVEAYQLGFEYFWRRRTVGREAATLFSASLIPRTVFEAAGGFDTSLRQSEDDDFGTRLPDRYRVVVSDEVRARHDDVEQLWPLLRKQFQRGSTKPRLMLRAWRLRRAGTAGGRVTMLLPAARVRYLDWPGRISLLVPSLMLLTLPVVPVAPWLLLAWPGLVAVFVAGNHAFLRLAYQSRGAGFAVQAAALHLLVHTVLIFGHGVGLLRLAGELMVRRPAPARLSGADGA
jgi:hypothetical protein